MKVSLLLLFLSVSCLGFSQIFSGTGGIVPDDGSSDIEFTLTVSGLPTTTDASFGLEQVCFSMQHTYTSDIHIWLISPSGVSVVLVDGAGGDSDDFTETCLSMSSTESIQAQSGPFTGAFLPFGNLGLLNDGANPNGDWKLRVFDSYPQDQGNLIEWNISFGTNPPLPPQPFTSSELPIFSIHTNGETIQDEPKVMTDLSVFWEPGQAINTIVQTPCYNGKIGIEMRGSSSQMFPKKSYGFETWDVLGHSMNSSLLNFPEETDWILSANYTDKSLFNNALAYKLFREMGHYAPRTKYVELMIDDNYQGIYVFMEKIKRGNDRVDIAKLTNTDISGDNLTGGYIVKIDKTTGNGGEGFQSQYTPPFASGGQQITFLYHYPSQDYILPQQKEYIAAYIDSFETALYEGELNVDGQGWRKYASERSFIDYMLINELAKNVDGYRISTYLHKDKNSNGGKLKVGPVWDYDIAFGNADYCGGNSNEGWAFEFNEICGGDGYLIPFWWKKMMTEDTLFQYNLGCRYRELRSTILDTAYLFHFIDSSSAYMQSAIERNFTQWPVLGSYIWPNPSPVPEDYYGEIQELKAWLFTRLNWLDNNMPNQCEDLGLEKLKTVAFQMYPNPAKQSVRINVQQPVRSIQLVDLSGNNIPVIFQKDAGGFTVELEQISAGVYQLIVATNEAVSQQKLVIVK